MTAISRTKPCSEFEPAGRHLIDSVGDALGGYLKTLENCEGYYDCPVGTDGKPIGPLVGYTADYEPGKKWVGFTYYNFSMADQWPAVLDHFAQAMADKLRTCKVIPDLIVGAPWAGVKCSLAMAQEIGCRHIFAEKKGDELILGRYEGMIRQGDQVIIGEELVNNTSTTGKLANLIEEAGGHVVAIACAINRSYPFKEMYWDAPARDPIPIIGVIERETPQYRQNDPLVAEAIAAGNIVWKPKYGWPQLKAAMDNYRYAQMLVAR